MATDNAVDRPSPIPGREALLGRTLVELADTLVDNYDVVELLMLLATRCVDVLDVDAAGIMLAIPGGELRAVASSSEAMRLLELFELQVEEGPCLDCYRTTSEVASPELASADTRWPRFAAEAVMAGFRSVHALPMRLRGTTIGALNLFMAEPGPLSDLDVLTARALAGIATIGVLQHTAAIEAQRLNDQLQNALTSRVVIEQARGMVAEAAALDMAGSFSALRSYARDHGRRLGEVALDVVEGRLGAADLPTQSTPARDAGR